MIRLFETSQTRKKYPVEGIWDFQTADGFSCLISVPGCWEQHPSLIGYRGQAIYERELTIQEDGNLLFTFGGVSHTAEVVLDGQTLCTHYNAYTPFTALAANVTKGTHTLAVRVDNSFGEASALHVENDYYTYGGITRGVKVERVGGLFISRMGLVPAKHNGVWRLEIRLELCGVGEETAQVRCSVAGEETVLDTLSLSAGETLQKSYFVDCSDVQEWSCEAPALYEIRCELVQNGKVIDDLTERTGFRQVEIKGNRLYLNDKPVFLKGFNRHEEYADFGCSVPLGGMVKDLALMRDMGANAVRTCHYPNDQLFLDLCDQEGFLVWEENHARGLSLEQMQNPNFESQCEQCNREMVEWHISHPSIVIWAILNECESAHSEGREMYKKQLEQIRSMDHSRPLTFATCRHYTDICLDLADIVSLNLYFGWYSTEGAREGFLREHAWAEQSGGAGKPVIISEFGAGAIYGNRDPSHCKWSEERQCDILEENLAAYLNLPQITGVFLWQFCDCRVCDSWAERRPRCRNNKGVVDEYRRPKLAFETVKRFYQSR